MAVHAVRAGNIQSKNVEQTMTFGAIQMMLVAIALGAYFHSWGIFIVTLIGLCGLVHFVSKNKRLSAILALVIGGFWAVLVGTVCYVAEATVLLSVGMAMLAFIFGAGGIMALCQWSMDMDKE